MIDPKKPDWDSFETYKGPDEEVSGWAGRLFHWVMMLLLFIIVFAACGAFAFLLPYGYGGRTGGLSRTVGWAETEPSAWIRFGIGGAIGVGWLLKVMYGRIKRNGI